MDEPSSSREHLEGVSALADLLAGRGITVYRYVYDYIAFGSWEIVAGTRKRRLRVTWDGKESRLDAASSTLADSGSVPVWEQLESTTIESGGDKAVFTVAGEIISRHCGM